MSRKPTPEEVQSSEEIKREPTFGEQFNFDNMFRVKGKPSLVALISHQHPSKMCVVCDIYTPNSKRSESVDKMTALSSYGFVKTDASVIGMTEVFTNIANYAMTSDDYAFEKMTVEEMMPIMVPDYDKDEFKLYHAKQVLGWYIEVTLKYSALIDQKEADGEIEILTDKGEDHTCEKK